MIGVASFTAEADVIIVGSGPAGISAAWPLVEAGVRVLMLDAASGSLPSPPAHASAADWRADATRWAAELGTAGPITDSGMSPKFATPLARAALDAFTDQAGVETRGGFVSVGAFAAGGLSRVWGALAARYDAADLAAFPGNTAAIEASYDRVAQRIGVSGGHALTRADLARLTPVARRVAARHLKVTDTPGFALTTAPNAVLIDEERKGRLACTACGLCLHGCGRGSIYHSAAELPALRRHSNFRYHAATRVERIDGAEGAHIVVARFGNDRVTFHAPVVVLAAGTLMTTGLALRRLGLIGRPVRLQTNPVAGMAFVVPSLVGVDLPVTSFGLGQMAYALKDDVGIAAAGVFYGADTLPLSSVADRLPFTRPFALRAARALAPALLLATAYLPGRFSDNTIMLDADGHLIVTGNQTAQATHLLRSAHRTISREARRRGAWSVPGTLQILAPGADAHPAATLPMGGQGPVATGVDGVLNGVPGLYVADGAALPVLSAHHPTLTIMANADRIGRSIARRFAVQPRIAHAG